MGDWQPERSLTLDVPDKPIGLEKRSTLHLWVVPAQLQGRWCTAGGELDITQRFQTFSATLRAHGANAPLVVFDGRITPTGLHAGSDANGATVLMQHEGNGNGNGNGVTQSLKLTRGIGPAARFEGQRFRPAGPQGCR
jgi:hypothetical protein